MKIRSIYFKLILTSLLFSGIYACSKSIGLSEGGPYVDVPDVAIHFLNSKPEPADGEPGDEITFKVKGLNTLSGFKFYVNQIQAEVLNFTDSLITIKIPDSVSTGTVSVLSNEGQYYYGPVLRIDGKVSIDNTFDIGNGTNGQVNQVIASGANNLLAVGSFTDFKGQSANTFVNNIVLFSKTGAFVSNSAGTGAGGFISSIIPITNSSQFLIGGSFSSYNDIMGLNNLARLNTNLSVDSVTVDLINPDPVKHPENNMDTVSNFNGGVSGQVVKLFYNANKGSYIGIGNFDKYIDYYYERSEKNTYLTNITRISNFVRFNSDGLLDSTFNFDPALKTNKRVLNGYITDGVQLADGRVCAVGSFTTFKENSAPGIVVLNVNGDIATDPTFMSNIGSGADGDIYKVTYNGTTHKIIITGKFKNFNGQPANGLAVLNEDGTVDNSFILGKIEGGSINYAGQLNNGLIIVSGTFQKYKNYIRQGFMILNPDGSLANGYNNTGAFSGQINGIMEMKNSLAEPSVLIYGDINLFDNVKANNLVRISFDVN